MYEYVARRNTRSAFSSYSTPCTVAQHGEEGGAGRERGGRDLVGGGDEAAHAAQLGRGFLRGEGGSIGTTHERGRGRAYRLQGGLEKGQQSQCVDAIANAQASPEQQAGLAGQDAPARLG